MLNTQPPFLNPLRFTEAEIELLGRTADALSAWLGKPVLAEIVDASDTGYEWAMFAVPLLPEQDPTECVVVQVGGDDARILGNRGGLAIEPDQEYLCEYLWGIQLSDIQGVRYIKVDADGEEIAWSDRLREILPFDIAEPPSDAGEGDENGPPPPQSSPSGRRLDS